MGILRKLQETLYKIKYWQYFQIYQTFAKYTMISQSTYVANLLLATQSRFVPGAIVECGTWKGGMISGIAKILENDREYFLFDSFEGLPKVEAIDGPAARRWQENTDGPTYYNNCTAVMEDAFAAMSLANISSPTIVKGWFEDTLPTIQFPNGIAILRMDADWYRSTMQIFESLFPYVNHGGIVLIDDYYNWDGCSRAVHDFLSKYKRSERINIYRGVCFLRKDNVQSAD